jgi:hypothetical protein
VGNKDFGQVVVWDYFGDLEFDRMAAGSRADLLPDQSSGTRYANNPFFSLQSRTIMREG